MGESRDLECLRRIRRSRQSRRLVRWRAFTSLLTGWLSSSEVKLREAQADEVAWGQNYAVASVGFCRAGSAYISSLYASEPLLCRTGNGDRDVRRLAPHGAVILPRA
jgi:hypothetical protein